MIYMDNASTTKIDNEVLDAMMPFLTELYGNAGTLYSIGRQAADAIAKARRQVADLIGAEPEQIIFTSGGTESNNMVFAGLRDYLLRNSKTHVVTTKIEHDSVLKAVKNLTKGRFYATYVAPNADGEVCLDSIMEAITYETGIVSVMHTNNETGVENQVKEIAGFCKERGILFHTDCVQACTCTDIDVEELGCDFLSLSSHKLHGPKGVGALYVRDKSLLQPIIIGGASQEFGMRGGTENVAGIVGLGKACEITRGYPVHVIPALKHRFYDELISRLTTCGVADIVHINGNALNNDGKVLNLRFDDVDGETLLLLLNSYGLCVSAGSACRSHESEPSHVLTAMGISAEDARNSIRFSVSRMNTFEEMMNAAGIVADAVDMLLQRD